MPGTGTLVSALTAELLSTRLKLAASALLAAVVGFAVLDLIGGRALLTPGFVFAVAVVGSSAVLLASETALSLRQLRVVELAVFGSVALWLAARSYSLLGEHMAGDDAGLALSALVTGSWQAALLAVGYGVLIPGSWRRGVTVTLALVMTPVAVLLLFQLRDPELSSGLSRAASGELIEAALLLFGGTAISLLAMQIMRGHQGEQLQNAEFGFYTLTEQIGAGGMGEVWIAQHAKLVRPAAIKLIRPDVLGDVATDRARQIVGRFEREAQATAALRSAHTIELYDFGVAGNGVFYYVMEYLDGVDLASLVRKYGPLSPARAVYLLRQACDSLAEAHDKQLIHRDVKPSNILTCRMGRACDFVKVLDFGLVKTETNPDEDSQLSVEGAASGTPAFMAPELAVGSRTVDARADIYSLGCVAYWLLTGSLVFESETALAMMVDHAREIPQPASERTPGIPEKLDQLVLRCLEKDPADRFQAASELSTALAEFESDEWSRETAARWWANELPAAPSPA